MSDVLPCPFCGHQNDISDPDTLHLNGIYWSDTEHGRVYFGRDHQLYNPDSGQCWLMNCNAPSGGCGAMILADGKDEAIEMWNKRHSKTEAARSNKSQKKKKTKLYLVKMTTRYGHVEGVVFSEESDALDALSGTCESGSTLACEWCEIYGDNENVEMIEIEI